MRWTLRASTRVVPRLADMPAVSSIETGGLFCVQRPLTDSYNAMNGSSRVTSESRELRDGATQPKRNPNSSGSGAEETGRDGSHYAGVNALDIPLRPAPDIGRSPGSRRPDGACPAHKWEIRFAAGRRNLQAEWYRGGLARRLLHDWETAGFLPFP
ncbi:MAG: hypothetical protein JWR03_2657 [Cohnella sp.]|nr:hypothetical protein [Cohnella sp.]